MSSVSRAKEVYFWWLTQLSAAIIRKHPSGRPWRTMLHNTRSGLEIFANSASGPKRLATLPADPTPEDIADCRRSLMGKIDRDPKQILLRLSPNDIVQKTIRVPYAALDLMDSVVDNKIETIVPWSQENTYYGYRVAEDVSGDQIDAVVIATSKQLVDSILERAASIGLTPRAVDFAPTIDDAAAVDLLSLEPDPIIGNAKRLNIAFVAAVCCSLAISLFGAYQVWALNAEYTELNERTASIMARVEEVKRLNDENEKLKEQRERLARRKEDNRPVMELIEALSRALPDSAYLEELEIHDNEARLVGKSADPTDLIGILESTPEFEDVRFSAPTTREDGQTLGTFSIMGHVQQKSDEEKSK